MEGIKKNLTHDLKERCEDVCVTLLQRFEADRDGFLRRLMTQDECREHYFQSETKRANKEWRHSSSPNPKKFRTTPSAGKLISSGIVKV